MDESRSGLSQAGLRDWVSVLWGSHRVQRERILCELAFRWGHFPGGVWDLS